MNPIHLRLTWTRRKTALMARGKKTIKTRTTIQEAKNKRKGRRSLERIKKKLKAYFKLVLFEHYQINITKVLFEYQILSTL